MGVGGVYPPLIQQEGCRCFDRTVLAVLSNGPGRCVVCAIALEGALEKPGFKEEAATDRLRFAAWITIAICGIAVFYGNLRFGRNVLAIGLEDDFFYYAQAANNLALHGLSSFDGVHLTNGYHPLWMLVITGLLKLFGAGGTPGITSVTPFAVALETVQLVLVLAIAFFVYRVVRVFCGTLVSVGIQLLVTSWALVLVRTGMEVGLALAFALALLWFRLRKEFAWTLRSCFLYGLLASAMVLSRLDTMLLVAMLFVLDVVPNAGRGKARLAGCLLFCIGMWPVAVYWGINQAVFHTLMPISGTAKQLRAHHLPSLVALRAFVGYIAAKNSPLLGPAIALTLLALAWIVFGKMRRHPAGGVLVAVLLFPVLHLLVISSLSDWPLWQWYLYPWLLASVAASAVMFAKQEEGSSLTTWADSRIFVLLCGAFLVADAMSVALLSNPRNNLPYVAALEIRGFAQEHPGIYAMGDRAGTVGYLSGRPVVQLEGLMMDRDFLENIRQRRDLLEVLRSYEVRYYISTRAVQDAEGCWKVKEPWQAGEDSPAMSGRICRQPVAVFSHGRFVNDIFDLQAAP